MRFAGSQDFSQLLSVPDFNTMSQVGIEGRGLVRNSIDSSQGYATRMGLSSAGKVKSAGYQADAIRAEGAAQGQQAMASGLGSMFSGLAGGFGAMGSGSASYGARYEGTPQAAANVQAGFSPSGLFPLPSGM